VVLSFFSILLAQKETKKGPGNNNSLFPVGIPIKLWYYCGEVQWGPYVVPSSLASLSYSSLLLGMKNKG
jgi:hypothetical protein